MLNDTSIVEVIMRNEFNTTGRHGSWIQLVPGGTPWPLDAHHFCVIDSHYGGRESRLSTAHDQSGER